MAQPSHSNDCAPSHDPTRTNRLRLKRPGPRPTCLPRQVEQASHSLVHGPAYGARHRLPELMPRVVASSLRPSEVLEPHRAVAPEPSPTGWHAPARTVL